MGAATELCGYCGCCEKSFKTRSSIHFISMYERLMEYFIELMNSNAFFPHADQSPLTSLTFNNDISTGEKNSADIHS